MTNDLRPERRDRDVWGGALLNLLRDEPEQALPSGFEGKVVIVKGRRGTELFVFCPKRAHLLTPPAFGRSDLKNTLDTYASIIKDHKC